MTLEEYINRRGGGIIGSSEAKALGIDLNKGWKKRFKHIDFSDDQISKACAVLAQSRGSKFNKSANKILTADIPKQEKQLIYLMKNQIGLYKIGISNNPQRRCNDLIHASGVIVFLLAAWNVNSPSREAENKLHKHFRQYRRYGEWFEFKKPPLEEIESVLGEYKTIVYNDSNNLILDHMGMG